MSLAPGARLGAYEIVALIGAGMGKVLPESFAADPERVARFEREAKTLASLNHPNIAQIYGIEDGPASASAGSRREGTLTRGLMR